MSNNLLREQAYLNGRFCDADNHQTFTVLNPANQQPIGVVPKMGVAETRRAIDAAAAAAALWRNTSAKVRSTIMRRWYELIMENLGSLSQILTNEQGKPLTDAATEIHHGAAFIEWFSEEAKRIRGDILTAPNHDRHVWVLKEAIGVCAAITPWNFPMAMIARKAGPALAAGCTMVIKPAEDTPFSALALAVLAEQAGFPPGVFNIVTGDNQDAVVIGNELTQNPLVRKLSFTGSTEIGRLLMRQSAATVKKLSLELGGNAPFIVFEDAQLDDAVSGLIQAKFRNMGQTCVCPNRVYLHTRIAEAFIEKLTHSIKSLKVGNGWDKGVQLGPLINQAALEKIETLIADALAQGAERRLGGQRHELGHTFFQPTILSNMNHRMRMAKEEIFGPVVALYSFQDEAEVVNMANDTEYGLASYVYSQNMTRIFRMSEQLEYGMVGVNMGLLSNETAPFGGIKQSGFGREGSHYGIEEYLITKQICLAREIS